jgi:hypothetical protein
VTIALFEPILNVLIWFLKVKKMNFNNMEKYSQFSNSIHAGIGFMQTSKYGNAFLKLVTMVHILETSHYGNTLWKLVTMVTHFGN